MSAPLSSSAYPPSHPWFYVLGGVPLTPKQILARVKASKYGGYLQDEITAADYRCEPRRSEDLRAIRSTALQRVSFDLGRYRQAVRQLRQHHAEHPFGVFAEVHGVVSFKHNHIANELAHLARIDELLSRQRDLFEC